MRKRVAILGPLCVGVALAAGGAHARADFTVTVPSATVPLTQTDWSPATTTLQAVNPLQLQQFDIAKYSTNGQTAVLTGIDIKLDYEFDNRLNLTFANLATITVTAQGSMDVYTPGGGPGLANSATIVPTATFANTGSLTVNPANLLMKSFSLPNPPDFTKFVGSTTASYTDAATLSKFTGKLTVGLPAFAKASSTFTTSSGNGFGSSITFASATVTVIYHFIVPEPASAVLTGIGALGLVFVGRNRSRLTPSVPE